MAKPFVKWLGGKTRLTGQILKYCPNNIETYVEPLVGGGAVMFGILNSRPDIKNIIINDINFPLMNTYRVIKENPNELIAYLKRYEKLYLVNDFDIRTKIYYLNRDRFNDLKQDLTMRSSLAKRIEYASLLIFLNKTCFNGLYRENSKGLFNTPHGKYKNPTICDTSNILECSELFNKVNLQIYNMEFEDFLDTISSKFGKNTFVYFDPPYKPISETSAFTSYTKNGFDDRDHKHVKFVAEELVDAGCKVVISNSKHEYIEQIYSKWFIEVTQAARSVNCKGDKRGKIDELIIHN